MKETLLRIGVSASSLLGKRLPPPFGLLFFPVCNTVGVFGVLSGFTRFFQLFIAHGWNDSLLLRWRLFILRGVADFAIPKERNPEVLKQTKSQAAQNDKIPKLNNAFGDLNAVKVNDFKSYSWIFTGEKQQEYPAAGSDNYSEQFHKNFHFCSGGNEFSRLARTLQEDGCFVPGVQSVFSKYLGTGAGRSAQDSPEISFSKECA